MWVVCLLSIVIQTSAELPRLVYDQNIYNFLFDDAHPNYGVYNKNSPPIRKDDMTRYSDGMAIFEHSIDKFVDHHCDPYVNFLESKLFEGYYSRASSRGYD